MSASFRLLVRIVVPLVLLALGLVYVLYNQPHVDAAAQTAAHTLSATELFETYQADEAAANQQYLNQLLQLTGTVSDMRQTAEGGQIVILQTHDAMFGVNCAFEAADASALSTVETGQDITLKGFCAGLLMDVSLTRCVLVSTDA